MGSPGGGYDTYMRALIPHLEKKLGAKMLPTNEPGAGGLIAINHTLHAPPDGLTILLIGGGTPGAAPLCDAPRGNYDVPQPPLPAPARNRTRAAPPPPPPPYPPPLRPPAT